ncbi:MAG: ribonuclease P protein component [Christensenellales bacterium]
MKKENRLKKRKQFNWTFKNGQKCYGKNLILVFNSSWAKDYKVGFSVTKKVGKAVVRNKVKRRIKEAVRIYQNNIAQNHTLIFVAKPQIVDVEFSTIVKEVEFLLKKSGLFIKDE